MRILVISQYPIHPAIHGGQKRVSAIVNAYKKSHSVKHVAIFWQGGYRTFNDENSVHLEIGDKRLLSEVMLHPERSDLLLGRGLVSQKSKAYSELRSTIQTFNPQLIHVEQPYLVACIKKIIANMEVTPVLVHGSQNVEYQLKSSIYTQFNLSAIDLRYLLDNTDRIEKNAIVSADVNMGVSRTDVRTLRQKTKSAPWFVVPNGTADREVYNFKKPGVEGRKPKIIFVGSAHPPNYTGIESLAYDTSYLSKDNLIFLIGGVADYFVSKYGKDDPFWVGKKAVGQVSDEVLRCYIDEADIILLPINAGGGSNLKTAEALYSRKKVVGTTFAFRGFERYQSFPNVYIANNPSEFKDALLGAQLAMLKPYTQHEERLIKRLSWEYTLRPLRLVVLFARILLIFRARRG